MNRSSIASPLNAVAHRTACLMHAWHGISAKTSLEIIQKGERWPPQLSSPLCPSGVLSLSSGSYHTAKKHPQIHSQHKLLVPSVPVLSQDPSSWLNIFQTPKKILAPELRAPTRTNAMPLTQGDAGIRNKSIIHAEARISAHGDQE